MFSVYIYFVLFANLNAPSSSLEDLEIQETLPDKLFYKELEKKNFQLWNMLENSNDETQQNLQWF